MSLSSSCMSQVPSSSPCLLVIGGGVPGLGGTRSQYGLVPVIRHPGSGPSSRADAAGAFDACAACALPCCASCPLPVRAALGCHEPPCSWADTADCCAPYHPLPRCGADAAESSHDQRVPDQLPDQPSPPRQPAMAITHAKKDCGYITVGRKMAMDGLIVLIWQIMASDAGDEDADSDCGRPEKG